MPGKFSNWNLNFGQNITGFFMSCKMLCLVVDLDFVYPKVYINTCKSFGNIFQIYIKLNGVLYSYYECLSKMLIV